MKERESNTGSTRLLNLIKQKVNILNLNGGGYKLEENKYLKGWRFLTESEPYIR